MKFHRKILSLIIICYFTRKLCKSVNLTDFVFVGLKLHNKSYNWNLRGCLVRCSQTVIL